MYKVLTYGMIGLFALTSLSGCVKKNSDSNHISTTMNADASANIQSQNQSPADQKSTNR